MFDSDYFYDHFGEIAGRVVFIVILIVLAPSAWNGMIVPEIKSYKRSHSEKLWNRDMNAFQTLHIHITDMTSFHQHMAREGKCPPDIKLEIDSGEISTGALKKHMSLDTFDDKIPGWGKNIYIILFKFKNGDTFCCDFRKTGAVAFSGPASAKIYFSGKTHLKQNRQLLDFLFKSLHLTVEKHGVWGNLGADK